MQTPNQATLVYSGNDGTIEYDWLQPSQGSANGLGNLHVKTHLTGTSPTDLVLTPLLTPSGNPLLFQSAQWQSGSSGPVWTFNYSVAGKGSLSVLLQFSLTGKILTTSVTATQPWISSMDLGNWPYTSNPKSIPVPYYTGNPPLLLQSYGLFGHFMYDWRRSQASSIDDSGRFAQYAPLTNGTLNLFSENIITGVSTNMQDLFPDIGNPASPYVSQLSGKTVIDIWANGFDDVTNSLSRLSSYGIKNCAIILHNWQYLGYDNGLPQHYPSSPALGGDSALASLVQAGESLGCTTALHENYLDYYPDYSAFTPSAIALTSDDSLLPGWFNASTQLQAYAAKPAAFVANAKTQSPQIQTLYKPTASYIDGSSSVPPWWRVDMDSKTSGAGQFTTFASSQSALWSYERSVYQGPVFGEGGNHSFWTGMLDGVEAQFCAGGVPMNISASAPLLPDFDLMKIHPFQVNHGMGYYERWLAPGDDITRTDLADAYRMQEVIYGHAPFVSTKTWDNPAKILVEHNLVGPVAQRYGTQTVSSVQYQYKGNWTDLNYASKAGTWNRVQVRYANGDTIVANGSSQPLVWQGTTLPAYGWMATGSNLVAYTAVKNGITVDYAETANTIFANARNQRDLNVSAAIAQPTVGSFSSAGNGTVTFNVQWQVLDYAPINKYVAFVHFVSPSVSAEQGIVFQCDHSLNADSASQWQPGANITDTFTCYIPSGLANGAYSMRLGLYSPATGMRIPLAGTSDQYVRTVMGDLTLNGNKATFANQAAQVLQPDARLNNAGLVVDFGTVRTDGMVSAMHDGTGWTLRAYPLYRNVVVQVNPSRIPAPSASSIVCDSPLTPVQISTSSAGYWQIQMNGAKSCKW